MPIGEALSSILNISKWRKTRKAKRKTTKKNRSRSILDVTDFIRNIDGLESSYHSFDIDFQDLIQTPSPKVQNTARERKSENRKSLMSFMCGMNSFEFDQSNEDIKIPEKSPTTLNKMENRKSWMSLIRGSQNLDIEKPFELPTEIEQSPTNCNKTEKRKSWMSLMCGLENTENDFRKSVYRDSGISLLSEDIELPTIVRARFQSKSCDDIFDKLRQCSENCDTSLDESVLNNSMNNLFRTTSIQENSLRIMRKRHRNVKRRRGNHCDSCYSSCDFNILAGSKSESDLTREDSLVDREVRFVGIQDETKEKSVSSVEVGRYSSLQLKSWQIRRQRRDKKNKQKRESRNLELLLSKEFEFQERLIL